MLDELAARCRRELDESVVPFWLKHSPDRACGGYFTALDRRGEVYDDRKYMWLQGRAVWMFARLYNRWAKRSEYLEAAKLGAEFIRNFGRDQDGRVWFSLTRQGQPLAYQRKPYGAVFVMLGLLEYGKATSDASYVDEAVALFWRIAKWIRQPHLLGVAPPPPGAPVASRLAEAMVLAGMATELLEFRDDRHVRGVLEEAAHTALRHFDHEKRVFLEAAAADGSSLRGSPDGRLWSPGHSIEMAWFLLHALPYLPKDGAFRATALAAIEGSLELGWDTEFGGLYYMMDIDGKPPLMPEHFMKLWWSHNEAEYALALAYSMTGDERWTPWLRKVDDYAWQRYPDPEFGEWFGYLDRQGNRTHDCKGSSYKGFFHVPRFLMLTAQLPERSVS